MSNRMRIKYRAGDFGPGPVKNGHGSIATTWPELVHAAITVGRRGWRDVLKHGRHSFLEITYRATMLRANLQRSEAYIVKTDAYHSLDRSEKAAVSYFIGLTVAGLVARRLFDVCWPMHLDVYQQSLHPHLQRSGRPDLVGSDHLGRWCVIEAKGRSNGIDGGLVARAKDQTLKLRQVCGQEPRFRIASVAFFSRGGYLSLRLADPIAHHPHAVDWNFTENQFLRDYYQPYVDLLDRNIGDGATVGNADMESEDVDGMDILVAPLPDVDIQIGLARRIYDLVSLTDPVRSGVNEGLDLRQSIVRETPLRPSSTLEEMPTRQTQTFVGTDGILVRLGPSWFDRQENQLRPSLW